VTTFGSGRQLSSYLLADFSLFVEDFPLKNLEMALKIKNLTNESYKTRGVFGFVDGEGSSMYFTLSYKF
jgi:outer membrane receptor protein involved in Fe transport